MVKIAQLRVRLDDIKDDTSAEALALAAEIMRYSAEAAEENVGCEWRVAKLARECLPLARRLVEARTALDDVCDGLERMLSAVTDYRPRLRCSICELLIPTLESLEAADIEEKEAVEASLSYARGELERLSHNIAAAERGDYESIQQSGFLQHDPVEWSARWEEVIDEAQREVDDRLADVPRGVGFCLGYWQELKGALKRRGVSWRSPSQMNPCVMFD